MRGRAFCTGALVLALWASGAAAEKARLAVLDLVPEAFDRTEALSLSQRLRDELRNSSTASAASA